MAPPGFGKLGLWLHLGGQTTTGPVSVPVPAGNGPLVVISTAADQTAAARQVTTILRKKRPDIRLLDLASIDMPDFGIDLLAMNQLARARPAATLLLGADLPPALIVAMSDHGIPVILANARLQLRDTSWQLGASMRRELLGRIQTILVVDHDSEAIALRMNAPRHRISMTGPVTETRPPLPCVEPERAALALLLKGRHTWLAACVPPSEEAAVLDAHRAALRQSHRALLFLVPSDARRVEPLAAGIEASGMNVARRDLDEEPTEEVEVMISDGPTELGLWYRLAPVCYMGGTLAGENDLALHPFEPAALGSAIIHGPATTRHAAEWVQLNGARAARPVADAAGLATAIAELTQPDITASLAQNAWTVSTAGAGVATQIAAAVLKTLPRVRP
ncbi:3-deoxy-D-manno-octulosonic acid transferase [Paracoccus sp. (in: a-proteobacteria)]|uniref:3-deoxy-D-manno-octulosonic acid transferase n=1 Tax=Paracoccus sp. TaxID=267 RepID=UPI003A852A77